MSMLDSLLVALFVIGIVFVILAILIYLMKIQSITFNFIDRKNDKQPNEVEVESSGEYGKSNVQNSSEISRGELKLIGVDEKTAAIAMAIVCDELKVSLSELQFQSIKALD